MPALYENPATLLLLLLSVFVSGYAFLVDPALIDRLALRPRRIDEGREYHRFVSAGFVHAGLSHLGFNMLTLFFFGPTIERLLGPGRFLVLYFGSMLAAHALAYLLHRREAAYSAVGASGAISGVLFGYCLFFPFNKIYFFFIPVGIPAVIFAVGYVAISWYAMRQAASGRGGGIAHEAHLGGAIAGLVLTLLLEPRALGLFLRQLGL